MSGINRPGILRTILRNLAEVSQPEMVLHEVFRTLRAASGFKLVLAFKYENGVYVLHEAMGLGKSRVTEPGFSGRMLVPRLVVKAQSLPPARFIPGIQRFISGYRGIFVERYAVGLKMSFGGIPLGLLVVGSGNRKLSRVEVDFLYLMADQVELLGRIRRTYQATLQALVNALESRDLTTEGHSERVTEYSLLVARRLGIEREQELNMVMWGALLHDIGKIGIPDAILLKPSQLTYQEWQQMRKHPEIGYRIISGIDFLRDALPVILYHHERWDGKGYPSGLRGEEIPLNARIFAVVDAFDAMTTDRPYRRAMSYQEAREEIAEGGGTQFCPRCVDAFLEIPDSEMEKVRRRQGGVFWDIR